MGDGWETARRRTPGSDWCVIRLARRGVVERLELDTHFFKGNAPHAARIEASTRPPARELNAGSLGEGVSRCSSARPLSTRKHVIDPACRPSPTCACISRTAAEPDADSATRSTARAPDAREAFTRWPRRPAVLRSRAGARVRAGWRRRPFASGPVPAVEGGGRRDRPARAFAAHPRLGGQSRGTDRAIGQWRRAGGIAAGRGVRTRLAGNTYAASRLHLHLLRPDSAPDASCRRRLENGRDPDRTRRASRPDHEARIGKWLLSQ
jgi:hypothetical protein